MKRFFFLQLSSAIHSAQMKVKWEASDNKNDSTAHKLLEYQMQMKDRHENMCFGLFRKSMRVFVCMYMFCKKKKEAGFLSNVHPACNLEWLRLRHR